MSEVTQQNPASDKPQEINRRASQDMTETAAAMKQARASAGDGAPAPAPAADKPREEPYGMAAKPQETYHMPRYNPLEKNPFASPQVFRSSRLQQHFEMNARGMDYSPHRMGAELSNRLREYAAQAGIGPQRSPSVHGHELADRPEYLHRQHYGSQTAMGAHEPVAFRRTDDWWGGGGGGARAARFSSQEYLNAPVNARWADYRAQPDYRQRRRSQQDLHSIGHDPTAELDLRRVYDASEQRATSLHARELADGHATFDRGIVFTSMGILSNN
ncbi:hypothetical protein NE865_02153 [Phthorimaea operculella]|nr:hypothetical protein NE865_02153 [Phthorimaea operculella]